MKYFLSFFLILLFITGCTSQTDETKDIIIPEDNSNMSENSQTQLKDNIQEDTSQIPEDITADDLIVTEYVNNLDTPREIVFLDNNVQLVTQRPGIISKIKDGQIEIEKYFEAPSNEIGEGGLLGLALDPDYKNNGLIYSYYTYYDTSTQKNYNSVVSLRENADNKLEIQDIIIDKIPASKYHNGGRIAFGPDNKLYITTGDASNPNLAQDTESLAGKVLRINPDGTIPRDNPIPNSAVFTLGHRNPQGIARDTQNNMFLSSHGPTGDLGQQAQDRADYLESGNNYGWPEVSGPNTKGFPNPIAFWPDVAVAPSGIAIWNNHLLIATLKGESIFALPIDSSNPRSEVPEYKRWFQGEYGRIRTIKIGPDGNLYFLTSNNDGRGEFKQDGDKVYQIQLKKSS